MEAAASPLPSDETTPPVTKMYLTARSLLMQILRASSFFDAPARDRPGCRRQSCRGMFPQFESRGRVRALAAARATHFARAVWAEAQPAVTAPLACRHRSRCGAKPRPAALHP